MNGEKFMEMNDTFCIVSILKETTYYKFIWNSFYLQVKINESQSAGFKR